ncbi:DDX1 [Symbiodinium sp. CCMP2456]|nr:DDX1 [Symbiodinium sp. CCMP2456]
MSAFEELGICPEIIQAVEEDDWLLPTPVQQEAIPLILGGGDVLVAAETGSGKTGAFGLPCLQIVHETLRGKCSTRKAAASNLKCELNLNDKDMFVLVTEDGLECKSEDDKRWNGIRATIEVMQGCYMFEVEVVEGLVRIGWSAGFAKLEIGIDDKSFGFGSTGKKSWNRKFEDYGEAFEEGDIIGCLLDREKQTISFCKNGRDLGVAYKLPPDMQRIGLKPHICGKGFMAAARFDGPMEYPVEGYTPVGEIDPTHTPQGTSQAKGKRPPLCMILEPTRDLAEQTYKCMTTFNKYLDNPTVRITLFVGGIDEKEQFRALEEGVDIVVGTLQKLMDYVRRGKLDVTHLKFLVLDEADDLQKKDDRKEIPRLNAQIKRGRRDRVQTLFFSATLHTPEVVQMIEEITSRPIWVDLKGKDSVPETVHHVALYIDPYQDLQWSDAEIAVRAKAPKEQPEPDGVHTKPTMSRIDRNHPDALKMSEKIKMMKPKMVVKLADAFNMSQCLVFCRTNVDCNNLEDYMNRLGGTKAWGGKMETGKENPYSCVVLAGMRNQDERRSNLESFKEGDVRFLICTDVAARGIDIAGLPFVIQTTLPDDIENYIHRIGVCLSLRLSTWIVG